MDFIDTVIGDPNHRNVDWITIHPRTRSTPSTIPIRTEALEILTAKYSPTLPILLSGDVFELESLPFTAFSHGVQDDFATLTVKDDGEPNNSTSNIPKPSNTGLSGFMSARGLLANPAFCSGYSHCSWDVVETFMCNVARAPLPLKLVVHHIQEMCSPGLGRDKHALLARKDRIKLTEFTNMIELIDFLDEKMEESTGQAGGLRRDL